MVVKDLLVLCGIAGSCTAVGVPVSVQESQRLRAIGGEEGANADGVKSFSELKGTLNDTLRVSICKELGGGSSSYVNNGTSTSNLGTYSCRGNGSTSDILSFKEDLKDKYYDWEGITDNYRTKIRCLRTVNASGTNSSVDGTQCKKK